VPLPFTVSDVYPGKITKAFYKIQDYASNFNINAHKVGISVNNDPTVYDSALFDKNAQHMVSGQFNSNLLVEGNNNLYATSFPIPTRTLILLHTIGMRLNFQDILKQ